MSFGQILETTSVNSLFALVLAVSIIVFWLYQREIDRRKKAQDELLLFANKGDFFMKRKYMRPEECEFYKKLQYIVGENYYLFPQVHLSSIINIKNDFKDHDNLYMLLGNKSVDYVVVRKDMYPVLVIELNGKSHFSFNRRNRDELVKSLIEKIGIKFMVINRDFINLENIEKEIKGKLLN